MQSKPTHPTRQSPQVPDDFDLLESIRRIIHGYDLHSRRLFASSAVTLAQLLCLRALADLGPSTAKRLAQSIHISASTMVGILDRLEAKRLIGRERDARDRRQVFVTITGAGRDVIANSPPPLGEELQRHLARLPAAERRTLAAALESLANLIEPDARRAK